MIRNINMIPTPANTNSIIGSRAYTFLDSYIYMKNQRYNALYEKNKEILSIENNAISLKSANALYIAFTEQVKILDSIVIRIRNFGLQIKPDVLENINLLIPSLNALNDFDEAIKKIGNFDEMKYIHYDINPIKYENMASFMNLYRTEIKGFMSINNLSANRDNPFIKDRATKYLIDIASTNKNSVNQLLEMEHVRIITYSKLKNISSFFRHKSKFISNLNRDFKTFQFYLKQYSHIRDLVKLIKPTEHVDGMVSIPGNKNIISFNDYFVMYKHFNSMIKYMIDIISYREQQFFNKIYALQSNIESYTSIINDVIDIAEKIDVKENEDDLLTESVSNNSYDEMCRICKELGYASPSIVENGCYSVDTAQRPITKEMFRSLGYDYTISDGDNYPSYKKDLGNGYYFYIDNYNPNANWHMIILECRKCNEAFDDGFLNSDTIDAHQMINGNDQAHMLLYDTVDGAKDEDISNFEEYDGIIPKEGVSVCTLRDSLKL